VSRNLPAVIAVLGKTGSGKSAWVKQELKRRSPSRLIIWDPLIEYTDAGVTSAVELLHELFAPKFRVVYHPPSDAGRRAAAFDLVCRAAYAAGNLTLVVEELRFVTTPSRAPAGWAQVTMTGRHRGLTVIGTSQRPASIDKDFLGNCTLVHSGALVYPEDAGAVAKVLQVNADDICNLAPLAYIERDMQTGKNRKGNISFQKSKRKQ
jgi:hypothetical protein